MAEIAPDIYGGDLQSNPEFVRHMSHSMHSNEPMGYLYQLMAAMGWTSLPWLRFIRQPTLILADDDPIVPAINAKIMHRLIPHSKLHIYHGGHSRAFDARQGIDCPHRGISLLLKWAMARLGAPRSFGAVPNLAPARTAFAWRMIQEKCFQAMFIIRCGT